MKKQGIENSIILKMQVNSPEEWREKWGSKIGGIRGWHGNVSEFWGTGVLLMHRMDSDCQFFLRE